MVVVGNWDSGLAGANWDSGLQWDVNNGPNVGDITKYLSLVTSQHNDKPKFMALVAMLVQPVADISALLERMPDLFDLDKAIGDQLDIVGEWVGITRNISIPLPNVYFSLGVAGLGLNEGTLKAAFDPTTGLLRLPDDAYRTLLRARIAMNHWDGTIPDAYKAWDALFAGTGFGILIIDGGDMSMIYALTGPVPDAVTLALLTGGYLSLKPAGVHINSYITPSVPHAPYFGIGIENGAIAGLGTGTFGITSVGT